MADARASEQRWATGRPAGPVDGVPTSIKDVFLTRGWPTLRGSRTIDPAQPWAEDAPCVARLRDSGAVLLGKTTTPEIGWKGVTDSPLTGVTRNPWDPARTPGGSSGGAAAAVASGMGALAVGTDGGGSVRIPASFTGTVALKPTYGRIPLYPASPFGTLAHAGPMTRSVEDAALLLDVLSGPDSRDPIRAARAVRCHPGRADVRSGRSADRVQPRPRVRARRPGCRAGGHRRGAGALRARRSGRGSRPRVLRSGRSVPACCGTPVPPTPSSTWTTSGAACSIRRCWTSASRVAT